jgi:membrane-bound serine protease (ClpP class)
MHGQFGDRTRALTIFAASVLCLLSPMAPRAQSTPIVYVAPIEGLIDLGLAPFVQRIVEEAETRGAAAVILRSTPLAAVSTPRC